MMWLYGIHLNNFMLNSPMEGLLGCSIGVFQAWSQYYSKSSTRWLMGITTCLSHYPHLYSFIVVSFFIQDETIVDEILN